MTYPFGGLPENLAAFCRTLRVRRGFRVGPAELRDAARALEVVDLGDARGVRHALRAVLSGSHDEAAAFDAAFDAFFLPGPEGHAREERLAARDEPGAGGEPSTEGARARRTPSIEAGIVSDGGAGGGPMTPIEADEDEGGEAVLFVPSTYSPLEAAGEDVNLPRPDDRWRDAARTFVRRLQLGVSRRWRPAARGRRFDVRRTLRASLQTGGEPLDPRWLRRPRRTPRLVLFVDGSRSMREYARQALQVAVALASVSLRVEVFTFSTRLRRVSDDVRRAAAGEPRRLTDLHHAWAGGTSIGACLHAFLRRHGDRLLGRDTVVIIASDGLDVGDAGRLRDAMHELHRRSAGVVWLNPLLETEGYEPTASGMRAARPFVDTFAAAGTPAAFAALARTVHVRGR